MNPPTADDDDIDVGALYGDSRLRLQALVVPDHVAPLDVSACPGWAVRDVVAHLLGSVEDAAAGRLRGLPSPSQTAAQVIRHRDDLVADLIALWNAHAAPFERAVTAHRIWPAMLDVVSHEHDVRTALGQAGARDSAGVRLGARRLVTSFGGPAQLVVTFDDGSTASSPAARQVYALRTSHFEVLRLRLGRRTRTEVCSLAWSRDPGPILEHLFVFEPRIDSMNEPSTAAEPDPGRREQ